MKIMVMSFFYFILSASINCLAGGDDLVPAIDESDFPNNFTPIDESERAEMMVNECILASASKVINKYYLQEGVYPIEDEWLEKVGSLLIETSVCAHQIEIVDGSVRDYSGGSIHYIYESGTKIILYSNNLHDYSAGNYFSFRAYVLIKGKTYLQGIKETESGYELIN